MSIKTVEYYELRVPKMKNSTNAGNDSRHIQICRFCGKKHFSTNGVFSACECEDSKNNVIYKVVEKRIKVDKNNKEIAGTETSDEFFVIKDKHGDIIETRKEGF